MTRKDYQLIAGVLRDSGLTLAFTKDEKILEGRKTMLELITAELARRLQNDNPRFDSIKFIEASGGQVVKSSATAQESIDAGREHSRLLGY